MQAQYNVNVKVFPIAEVIKHGAFEAKKKFGAGFKPDAHDDAMWAVNNIRHNLTSVNNKCWDLAWKDARKTGSYHELFQAVMAEIAIKYPQLRVEVAKQLRTKPVY